MGLSIKREAFRARGLAWSEVQGTHGVSLVFREMWATTVLKPQFFAVTNCSHQRVRIRSSVQTRPLTLERAMPNLSSVLSGARLNSIPETTHRPKNGCIADG
jgi:hypothetical protein